ncbi:MAG: hypothetical protein ACKO2N_16175 [Tabrizicola sp.]
MIAFYSPEGETLRALKPSRSAKIAIWLAALQEGEDDWAAWAGEAFASEAPDAEILALRFIQAVADGNNKAMHQLWSVLSTFPVETLSSSAIQTARELRKSLPF